MIKKHKSHTDIGDSVILYPENYINDIEGEKLEDMCDSFLKKGFKKIIIDFSETDLINSIGISILVGVIEKIRENNGVVLFSGLKKVNRDIFNIVGLTKHVQIFDTVEEAINEVKGVGSGNTGAAAQQRLS